MPAATATASRNITLWADSPTAATQGLRRVPTGHSERRETGTRIRSTYPSAFGLCKANLTCRQPAQSSLLYELLVRVPRSNLFQFRSLVTTQSGRQCDVTLLQILLTVAVCKTWASRWLQSTIFVGNSGAVFEHEILHTECSALGLRHFWGKCQKQIKTIKTTRIRVQRNPPSKVCLCLREKKEWDN